MNLHQRAFPTSEQIRSEAERLASQRVKGTAQIAVRHRAGRTRLARLAQAGAAKIRLPSSPADPLEAILINTAGGLTSGDRLDWSVTAEADTSIMLTTQACEKGYRAPAGEARVHARISVGTAASVAWLPQETILYEGSALSRRLDVDMVAGARALIVEATVFGRAAMGETVTDCSFRDRWRVTIDGRLVHAEEFAVRGGQRLLDRRAIAGGARAVATVLLVDDDCGSLLDRCRAIIGPGGGASAWSVGGTGKLLARLIDEDSYSLRKRLMPLLAMLNGEAPLPKAWAL